MASCTVIKEGFAQKVAQKQAPEKIVDNVWVSFLIEPRMVASQPLKLELRLENKSKEMKVFSFLTSQKYDFYITDSSGGEIWRWSSDKAFLQVLEDFQIPPGARIAFIEKFDVTGVKPGKYTAYGILLTTPTNISFSDEFEITEVTK